MFPIRDNIPSRTAPVVNYSIIAICSFVFLAQLADPESQPSLIDRYGMIPAKVARPNQTIEVSHRVPVRTVFGVTEREIRTRLPDQPVPGWLTMLTCIFLHGGWMHFLGNMWFLYIFGDNVEDCFGHGGYLVFYLSCGVAASVAHLLSGPNSVIPTIGASGAIAGVMGAYMLLYPYAKVLTVVPIIFLIQILVLPAPFFLGIWFIIQFFQGSLSMSADTSTGVAWWAHIGGFVAGFVVARFLQQHHRLKSRVEVVRPHTERSGYYRLGHGRRYYL